MTKFMLPSPYARISRLPLPSLLRLIVVVLLGGTFWLPHAHAAATTQAGDLKISETTIAPTRPGQPSAAAFLTIQNNGKAPDQLIGVLIGSEIATRGELHTMKHENGMMMMREVPGFKLDTGKIVALKPGGDHLMLIGIQKPLEEGQQIPLTLVFEKAGKVIVNFTVKKPVMSKDGMHHPKH